MTTTTAPATRSDAARGASPHRLSFARLVRSETIKLTSLRSTWWSIGLVAVISVGMSLLLAMSFAAFASQMPELAPEQANVQAVQAVVFSTILTQLLAIILGAISVTGEYSTGMIRSTLTAAPGRIAAPLAKALVVGVALVLTGFVVFAAAALVTAPILAPNGLDLGDPAASLLPLVWAAVYLAAIAIIGVGLGFVIRNGPGALAVGIALVLVAPIIVSFFPRTSEFEWLFGMAMYLPSNAGQSLYLGTGLTGDGLDAVPAVVTLVAWAVGMLAAGIAVLKTRDA